MSYERAGPIVGSEVTDDPGVIARCREQAGLAARCAVLLGAFTGSVTA